MTIKINNIELNKMELLQLINNGKKTHAIKLIKTKSNLTLKDCKEIIDNLEINPNYYNGETIIKTEESRIKDQQKTVIKSKGMHIIKNNSFNTKTYIIVFLLICIAILLYMYNTK